jgi:hypothetical protein
MESPLTWWLDGTSVTADRSAAVKNCPLPLMACTEWLYATIEPPPGQDPAAIDPASVVLAGVVPADPAYEALVDRDGDGRIGVQEYVEHLSTGFRQMDADGNGVLEANELPAGPRRAPRSLAAFQADLRAQFRRMDRDGDGYLSARELVQAPE